MSTQPAPLIIGTAGHIDHGKTTLIRALTGHDCDTHREEQQRGITIHLGFTHLDLPNGQVVGVIDVPGHAAFIRTMVAGASGIDFVMLVIAADSGVMPQTHEHLQILTALGIRDGLIVMTKADLVDEEILLLAECEVRESVAGTFLAQAPVVAVSSVTGDGVEVLRRQLAESLAHVPTRPAGAVFRMFIDRIFSVAGAGTVVSGSVLSGTLEQGGNAYLLPGEQALRVRRLERFGMETPVVGAGDRAALNLVGLDRDDFRRGMVIADRPLRTTMMLDARFRLFPHARRGSLWSHVNFYLGTYEAQARVHLLDRDQVMGDEEAIVQIHLPRPCVAQIGDRFVVRSTSSDLTLGGGEVIDAFPLHHRRRPPKLIRHLESIACGDLRQLIAAEVRKCRRAVGSRSLAETLNLAESEIVAAVRAEEAGGLICMEGGGSAIGIVVDTHENWVRTMAMVRRQIEIWHKRNPLEATGPTLGELLGATGRTGDPAASVEFSSLLEALRRERVVKAVGHTWAAAEHEVVLTPQQKQHIQAIRAHIAGCGLKTPLMSEMLDLSRRHAVDERQLRLVLRHLVARGDAYVMDNNFVDARVVDTCRQKLLRALVERPGGLTVAEFRDLIDGNRKICLLLIGLFDNEGVTRREGDVRVITDRGRSQLEG